MSLSVQLVIYRLKLSHPQLQVDYPSYLDIVAPAHNLFPRFSKKRNILIFNWSNGANGRHSSKYMSQIFSVSHCKSSTHGYKRTSCNKSVDKLLTRFVRTPCFTLTTCNKLGGTIRLIAGRKTITICYRI